MENGDKLREQRDIAAATAFYWMRQAALIALDSGEKSLKQWQEAMKTGLHAAYEKMGAEKGSGPKAFLKYVVARDEALGLEAGGQLASKEELIYWIKDPFIPLKGKITEKQYEQLSTHGYLKAKIEYFCPDYKAKLVKSPWRGHDITEWTITKQ